MPHTDHTDPGILHARWLVACQQVRAAYRWWQQAGADYYPTLVAMIDQEEAAATLYAHALQARAHAATVAAAAPALVASHVG